VALVDVDQHVHRPHERSGVIEQRRRIGDEPDLRAIGAHRHRLAAADRPALAQRDGHRAFVVTHRAPIGEEELQRAAPQLAECRAAAPELGGRIVEIRDRAGGIGRVGRDTEASSSCRSSPCRSVPKGSAGPGVDPAAPSASVGRFGVCDPGSGRDAGTDVDLVVDAGNTSALYEATIAVPSAWDHLQRS
jgi:hypothetical protein